MVEWLREGQVPRFVSMNQAGNRPHGERNRCARSPVMRRWLPEGVPNIKSWVLLLGAWILCAGQGAQAADDVVVNPHGIAVKVITRRSCSLRARPDVASPGSPVRCFSYYYVLPPSRLRRGTGGGLEDLTSEGFYRVASGRGSKTFLGWLHEDDVVEWHHRQALTFAPRSGRQPAEFYRTAEAALAATFQARMEARIAREPDRVGENLIVMPILDRHSVVWDEMPMSVYEVAFLAGDPGAHANGERDLKAAAYGEMTHERALEQTSVDIVFVLDTSMSMEGPIAAVTASIEEAIRTLAGKPKLLAELRFGVVGYRDRWHDMGPQGMEYLTRVFCTLEEGRNHQVFVDRMRTLTCAKVNDDYAEDALAGIALAMNLDALKWNPYAWKHIIMVGDASMKEPGHLIPECRTNDGNTSIAGTLARAQPAAGSPREELLHSGFVISAIHVLNEYYEVDWPLAQHQMKTLVAGRTYPGEFIVTNAGEGFATELGQKIVGKMEAFDTARKSLARGGPGPPAKGASAAQFPAPWLDLLRTLPKEGHAVDTEPFKRGHCREFDEDGNRLFVPSVFVRKAQLKSFNSIVTVLQGSLEDAGEPGSRSVHRVVVSLQAGAISLNTAEPFNPEMDLSQFMNAIVGFPIKSSIFKVTPASLAAMNQADYQDWVKEVGGVTQTLTALLDNAHIWRKLHPSARERDAHAFVPIADLP